jgi:hypothetical protein
MRYLSFHYAVIISSQLAFSQSVHVRTVSQTGEALSAVNIWTFEAQRTGRAPQSDKDGLFTLPEEYSRLGRPRLRPAIRFTLDGYRPLTKVIPDSEDLVVVLRKDDGPTWTPDECDAKPASFRWFSMGFVLPKGAKLKHPSDFDSWHSSIAFQKSSLMFGAGLTWSGGHPSWSSFYENLAQLSERDVGSKDGRSFAEYKGVRANGTYFRWIGAFGVTVTYDDATKQAADYFDQILDSLCWYPTFFGSSGTHQPPS